MKTIKINIKNLNEDNIVETLKKTKEIWSQLGLIAIGIVNSMSIKSKDILMTEVTSKNPKFKELLGYIKLIFQKLKEKGVDVPVLFKGFSDKKEVRDLEDIYDIAKLYEEGINQPEAFDVLYDSLRDVKLFLDDCIFRAKHKSLLPTKGEKVPNSAKIEFLDSEPALKCADKKCPLPSFKNEHFLCRAVFEHPINEAIDWSEIYERMTGYYETYYGKPPATRKNWRTVYDAMGALNNRVKDVFGIDKIFDWKEKTIKRIR